MRTNIIQKSMFIQAHLNILGVNLFKWPGKQLDYQAAISMSFRLTFCTRWHFFIFHLKAVLRMVYAMAVVTACGQSFIQICCFHASFFSRMFFQRWKAHRPSISLVQNTSEICYDFAKTRRFIIYDIFTKEKTKYYLEMRKLIIRLESLFSFQFLSTGLISRYNKQNDHLLSVNKCLSIIL